MNELQTTERKTFSLVPQNLEQAIVMAERWSKSGVVPKHYNGNANAILVAWDFGGSLGLGLMQSLTGIAVINGTPCIWGDALLALVMASGQLEDLDESIEGQCTVTRKGKKPVTSKFSMADAKVAGLVGKVGPWTQYPARMLKMRNRGFALRDAFADILKGMQVAEEVQDYTNPYPNALNVEPTAAPIRNVLAESTKPIEPTTLKPVETVTDQETGEVTEAGTLSTKEMNEALTVMDEITDLREQKDAILMEQSSKSTVALGVLERMDTVIASGFKNLSLEQLKKQRDFLLNLA